jgi:Intracellular proteinase inhibitor
MNISVIRRVLLLLATGMIVCGTSGNSCSNGLGGLGGGGGGDQPTFVATLAVRDASGADRDIFAVGQPVSLVLSVRNRLNSAQTASFTTSRTADFVIVENGTTRIVWQATNGQTISPTATQLQFAANETKTFSATWNQTANGGGQVNTGTYEARGALVYTGFDSDPLAINEAGSSPVQLTITNTGN